MNKLHDYLDYDRIHVLLSDGYSIEGCPIAVTYADEEENECNEDIIDIETDSGRIWGIRESEIMEITVLRE